MAEPKVNSTLTTLLKQAQTVITFVYLIMVGVGMLYYHQKYSEFGINIFQYADIFYFLVAPFEDGFILFLCALAVLVYAAGFFLDRLTERKYPRVHTAINFGMTKWSLFKQWQSFSWPIAFVLLIIFYSQIYGEESRNAVLESDPITVTFDDGQTKSGQMIGKTNDMLFLLEADKVKVIPLNTTVKEMIIGTFSAPRAEPAPAPKVPAATK